MQYSFDVEYCWNGRGLTYILSGFGLMYLSFCKWSTFKTWSEIRKPFETPTNWRPSCIYHLKFGLFSPDFNCWNYIQMASWIFLFEKLSFKKSRFKMFPDLVRLVFRYPLHLRYFGQSGFVDLGTSFDICSQKLFDHHLWSIFQSSLQITFSLHDIDLL